MCRNEWRGIRRSPGERDGCRETRLGTLTLRFQVPASAFLKQAPKLDASQCA